MQIRKLGKRGILGMDAVKDVMVMALLLAVIAIALFAAVVSVSKSSVIKETSVNGGSFNNVTINLTANGATPAGLTDGNSRTYESLLVVLDNGTATVLTLTTDFTVNGTGALFSADADFQNLSVNVSAGYDYTVDSDAIAIRRNVTNGTAQFFENMPTVFVILGVVLIVLAVSLIIFAVNRFSSGTSSKL